MDELSHRSLIGQSVGVVVGKQFARSFYKAFGVVLVSQCAHKTVRSSEGAMEAPSANCLRGGLLHSSRRGVEPASASAGLGLTPCRAGAHLEGLRSTFHLPLSRIAQQFTFLELEQSRRPNEHTRVTIVLKPSTVASLLTLALLRATTELRRWHSRSHRHDSACDIDLAWANVINLTAFRCRLPRRANRGPMAADGASGNAVGLLRLSPALDTRPLPNARLPPLPRTPRGKP